MRYELIDIKIKKPGQQIKDRITDKFGSVEQFSHAIGLYEASILQYLSHAHLGSDTFKIKTTQAFGIDFNSLYVSEVDQIRHYTSTISQYIEEYNKMSDVLILEKLKTISIKRGLLEDYAIICRCFSYYYMNRGNIDRAISYIELAANYMRGKENIDRFGLYLSDLIWMKSLDPVKTPLNKLIDEFTLTIKKVKGPLTNGHMNFNLGRTYLALDNYQKSEHYLNKAFDYLQDDYHLAMIHLTLGDLYTKASQSSLAFKACQEAEKLSNNNPEILMRVNENYAQHYYQTLDLVRARAYINTIFSIQNSQITSKNHDFLYTFSKIMIPYDNGKSLIKISKRILKEIPYDYLYMVNHLHRLDVILETYAIDQIFIHELLALYKNFYRTHKYEAHIKEGIKQIIGTLYIKSI